MDVTWNVTQRREKRETNKGSAPRPFSSGSFRSPRGACFRSPRGASRDFRHRAGGPWAQQVPDREVITVTCCYANAVLNWSCVLEGFYQLRRLHFHGALKPLKEKNKAKRYKGSKAAYADGLYRICNFGANRLTSLLFYVLHCLDIHIMSLLSFGLWNWSLDFSFQFISVGVQIYI